MASFLSVLIDVFNKKCIDLNILYRHDSDYSSVFSVMCIIAVIYTVAITLGVIGNVMVILSVWKHRSLQSVQNIFIVSLSCSDIVYCLISGTITPINSYYKVWFFGKKLCKVLPVIPGGLFCFSTLMLSAIFTNRYMRLSKRTIVYNFVLAILTAFPVYFVLDAVRLRGICGIFCIENWPTHDSRSDYSTFFCMFQVLAPVLMTLFYYCVTCVELKSVGYDNNEQKHHNPQLRPPDRRLRTTRMLKVMVAVLQCSRMSTPVFDFLRDHDELPPIIYDQSFLVGLIAHCITISSTVLTPVLYTLLNDELRASFLFDHTKEFFISLTGHRVVHSKQSMASSPLLPSSSNNANADKLNKYKQDCCNL